MQKYCGYQKDKNSCSYKNYLKIKHRLRSERKVIKILKKCLGCNKEFIIRNTRSKYCGSRENQIGCAWSYKRYKGIPEEKRIKKRIPRLKLRFLILKKYHFTCRYCGRKPPKVELEIDHYYPRSHGGRSSIGNYSVACHECNVGKGDIILNEFDLNGKTSPH